MTEQDYVKLQGMEVELRQTLLELFTIASECVLDHQLPNSLAWLLQGKVSLIKRGSGASDCVEALRSTELLLQLLLPLCSDHAFSLESVWVKKTVRATEKRQRDLMVIRTQLAVPFDRDAFQEAVDVAHDCPLHSKQPAPFEDYAVIQEGDLEQESCGCLPFEIRNREAKNRAKTPKEREEEVSAVEGSCVHALRMRSAVCAE